MPYESVLPQENVVRAFLPTQRTLNIIYTVLAIQAYDEVNIDGLFHRAWTDAQ